MPLCSAPDFKTDSGKFTFEREWAVGGMGFPYWIIHCMSVSRCYIVTIIA